MINWTTVEINALSAVRTVLGNDWNTVATGATAQVQALISVMQSSEADVSASPPTISTSEYNSLILSAERAIEGVLQTYAAIGIVVAEQAAAAAVNVVVVALKTAYPAVAFL